MAHPDQHIVEEQVKCKQCGQLTAVTELQLHPWCEPKYISKLENELNALAKVYNATGIEAAVCFDIADRQQMGIKKYGQTVAQNPLELRAWMTHAYQEALDFCVYLKRAIAEIDSKKEVGP